VPDASTNLTDTSDMYAVHQVFRTAFGEGPALVRQATAAGPERATFVGDYYANVFAFLDVHHNGEDILVFPLLRERAPEQCDVVDRLAAAHVAVHDSLAAAQEAVATWAARPDASSAERAGDALDSLGRELSAHLDDEEQVALPLCAGLLSPEEWGALPGHGMANFTGDKIWLILGLIRENMTPEQRDLMLAHMPPPAVEMWTSMGEAAFTQYRAALDDRG
jgi:hypothetical protein